MWTEAIEAIKNSSESSSVYIGCDSIVFKERDKFSKKKISKAKYSTVIIVHKDSSAGCQLFHNTVTLRDFGNLRQRLMTEVGYAIEAAFAIVDIIGKRRLEVHLDINSDPKHASNIALKEAMGYVQGSGFKAVGKPNGFAATHCADHLVRDKHNKQLSIH